MTSAFASTVRQHRRVWPLAAFLCAVFLTGGASRIDAYSLIFLRPLTVVAATLALLTIRRADVMAHRGLFIGIALAFGLVGAQLIPLPPAWWQSLPGREQFARVDALAQLGDVWRPLSLTPSNTWHSLLALMAPLAVLLIGVQQRQRDLLALLPVLIVIGLSSALLGLIQAIGEPGGSANLYRMSHPGAGGLFANRNHAALLIVIMFPMLATWITVGGNPAYERIRLIAAVIAGLLLVPMIGLTGSRAGFLLSLIGIAAAFAIYASDHRFSTKRMVSMRKPMSVRIAVLGTLALLAGLAVLLLRGEALQRLMDDSVSSDTRVDQWGVAIDMARTYFPVGTGAGSIAEVYQIHEPHRLLNLYYSNHTHNEYLETVVTFGLPGILLILAGIWAYIRQCRILWRTRGRQGYKFGMARMASVAILMIGLASIADYPLRTPSMLSLFALLLLWFVEAGRSDPKHESSPIDGGAIR